MSNQPLTKIQASTAAEVCARFDLAKDAKPLLREGMKPAEFLAALLEQKKHVDAIMFLAHALPPRESVWWGCLCMQHASGGNLLPADKAAARAAAQWVMNPTEENRAAAKAPSEAAPPPSVAGTLARAAHQSGGSVAPPGMPPQAPQPYAFAAAVATAVKLASTKADPVNIAKTQGSYVHLGLEVAQGRFL